MRKQPMANRSLIGIRHSETAPWFSKHRHYTPKGAERSAKRLLRLAHVPLAATVRGLRCETLGYRAGKFVANLAEGNVDF